MTFKMMADRMTRHGITLPSDMVHNTMRRLGVSLGIPTVNVTTTIRKAKILYIDETSLYLNYRTICVQILHDPLTEYVLYTMQSSRRANVLNKTLKNWNGISVRRLGDIQEISCSALRASYNTRGKRLLST